MSLFFLALLAACASTDKDGTRLGSDPGGSYLNPGVDAAAFGSDHFTFDKKQMIRPPNDFEYYFKRCEMNWRTTYYSKTSYDCLYP